MGSSLEAKIVVLGAQGVGKTSLLTRYCKGTFDPAGTTSTVGANFLTKRVIDADSDIVVRLQLWDTAGQERFRSISRLYYRGANACILCYSITDAQSFVDMGLWLTELRQNLPDDVILHVVGTKADLVARDPSAREVPFERCIAYVAEHLQPGHASTPPSSSLPSATSTTSIATAAAAAAAAAAAPVSSLWMSASAEPRSPSSISKRSSGFWGQDAGWNACHEVSAETGEGVEEVFRVVGRKLVEQNLKMRRALLTATAVPGMPGYENGMDGGYFGGRASAVGGVAAASALGSGLDGSGIGGSPGMYGHAGNGSASFHVGRDRRSWIYPSSYSVNVDGDETTTDDATIIAHNNSRCC